MYDWVLNTASEGFVQDVSQQELAIDSVARCSKTTAWQTITNKLAVSSTMDTLLKTQIFVDVFLIEKYEYDALRKEPFIAHFVERFKTTNLGKRYS